MVENSQPAHIYTIHAPKRPVYPFLLNAPHSGEVFDAEFLVRSQLSRTILRRASDLYVDRFLWPLASREVSIMAACFPRSFLDVNREPLELDPRLIEGDLPREANVQSLRVAGGLGTVPRVIGDQIEIYAGKLSLEDVFRRIEHYYLPYHTRLKAEMARLHALFGRVYLIDCHSMPSRLVARDIGRPLPDIVLGDRFGTSCTSFLVDTVEAELSAHGLRVERNKPYAGGYITENYGQPKMSWHALQIEINRSLYMDETRLEAHAGFLHLSAILHQVLDRLFVQELYENHSSGLHFTQNAAE